MKSKKPESKASFILPIIETWDGTNGCVNDGSFNEITEILDDGAFASYVDVVEENVSSGGTEHAIDSTVYELMDHNNNPHYFELWIQVPNCIDSYENNNGCYPFGFHRIESLERLTFNDIVQ